MTTLSGSSVPSEWSRRLVSTLVASGDLLREQGERSLEKAAAEHRCVAEILSREQLMDAATVLGRMAQLSGLTAVDIYSERPMGEAFKAVPEVIAREYNAIGYRIEGNALTMASVEPLSAAQLRQLSNTLRREIAGLVLADPVGIERVMEAVYPRLGPTELPPQPEPVVESVPDATMATAAIPLGMGATATGTFANASLSSYPQPSQGDQPFGGASSFGTAGAGGEPYSGGGQIGGYDLGAFSNGNGSPQAIRPATPPGFRPSLQDPRPFPKPSNFDIDDLLGYVIECGASDLHLTNQQPPSLRVDGSIRPIEGLPPLEADQVREMVFGILTQSLRERFEAERELDTSHSVMGVGRFRVNVYLQKGSVGAAFRAIPHEIPPFETLNLPDVISSFTQLRRGLVLVTGPTGSGKSTTLASLVNIINRTKPLHIVTIEDPIEFIHTHDRAIVNQREVGADTHSFAKALRHVLRQDPDVILVGELRDTETIATALTAAETGHLVFATLHTQDAPQTVDRIIDVFPTGQQDQIRIQLASSLEAVVTQQLVVNSSGLGRVPVAEIMIGSPAVSNLIRSAKTHQIYSLMQTGSGAGMQTMDQALSRAVRAGKITEATAFDRCHDPNELRDHLKLED